MLPKWLIDKIKKEGKINKVIEEILMNILEGLDKKHYFFYTINVNKNIFGGIICG